MSDILSGNSSSCTVRATHAEMDAAWQRLLIENQQRKTEGLEFVEIACRRGCAACCTWLPDARVAEAEVLAEIVERAEQRTALLTRLYDWREVFERWLEADPAPDPVADNTEHLLWRQRWQVKRIACPFLNLTDHACGVYEDRPFSCRAAHAAYPPDGTEPQPGDGCFTRQENVDQGVLQKHWGFGDQVVVAFADALTDALTEAGIETRGGILTLEVLHVGEQRYGWRRPLDVPRLAHT